MMRVLWFTNTPSLAADHLNLPAIGGGWIGSLEAKLQGVENLELAVAFTHGDTQLTSFKRGNTTYYAIPNTQSKLKKWMGRHLNRVSDKELLAFCRKIIVDFKPDIINVFGTEKGFGLIGSEVNIPVVIHLQGILTVYEKKWFASGINKWDLFYHSGLPKLIRGNSLIYLYKNFKKAAQREREIFKTGKFFMGRTDWDRRITAVLAPGASYYNGDEILRTEFYLHQWTKKTKEEKILFSTVQGNIYKGLETVLESATLLKKLNRFSFSWFIAGISDGDTIVKIFEKKSGKRFKDVNIVLSGPLQPAALVNAELDADVFIHPSHIDNSPNSVCEAMLLGMPVIATYTGGTGSLLTDRKEGILIQDGDPYAMAGAILELIENPDYAVELGQNARKRALPRHDPDRIANNLLTIYSQITSILIR